MVDMGLREESLSYGATCIVCLVCSFFLLVIIGLPNLFWWCTLLLPLANCALEVRRGGILCWCPLFFECVLLLVTCVFCLTVGESDS